MLIVMNVVLVIWLSYMLVFGWCFSYVLIMFVLMLNSEKIVVVCSMNSVLSLNICSVMFCVLCGLMNCGRNMMKNSVIFGFIRLLIMFCWKIVLSGCGGCVCVFVRFWLCSVLMLIYMRYVVFVSFRIWNVIGDECSMVVMLSVVSVVWNRIFVVKLSVVMKLVV